MKHRFIYHHHQGDDGELIPYHVLNVMEQEGEAFARLGWYYPDVMATLTDVSVAPYRQKMGLGAELVSAVEARAARLGVKRIAVTPRSQRQALWFIDMGYRPYGLKMYQKTIIKEE